MPKLLSILSDQPADRDQLNFGPYVRTLVDIISDPGSDTPLTVGVFGDWGRGKTSLMRMVERQLKERTQEEQQAFAVLPIWFNAWLYSREGTLWRALIARVLTVTRAIRTTVAIVSVFGWRWRCPPGSHLWTLSLREPRMKEIHDKRVSPRA